MSFSKPIERPDIKTLTRLKQLEQTIKQVHRRFKPHKHQAYAVSSIINERPRHVAIWQCGRNFGKSTGAAYTAVRWALTHPRNFIYIIAPKRNQAQEIYWSSGLIRSMVPRDLLLDGDKATNKNELRYNFKNGSFIKLEGIDNPDLGRGVKGHGYIYDECQLFTEEAHGAIEPNFFANNAWHLCIGTPPQRHCWYLDYRKNVLEEFHAGNRNYFYMELPTEKNPYIDPEKLAQKKKQLIRDGKKDYWLREYMAQYVPGSAGRILPHFDPDKHLYTRQEIMSLIDKDRNKLEWYTIFDPGTTTVFGVIFAALNRYRSQVYILGEIYEKDKERMSASQIWERARDIEQSLHWDDEAWVRYCDEAAAWFINEIQYRYGAHIYPTQKHLSNKEDGISLLNDLMFSANRYVMHAGCRHLQFEIENYVADEEGRIPKKDDHLLDCLRYLLDSSNYDPIESPEVVAARPQTLTGVIKEYQRQQNPFIDMEADLDEAIYEDDAWMI